MTDIDWEALRSNRDKVRAQLRAVLKEVRGAHGKALSAFEEALLQARHNAAAKAAAVAEEDWNIAVSTLLDTPTTTKRAR